MTRIWLVNWHFQSRITLRCRHKSTNVSMGLCWQMPKFIVWHLWSIYFDHHLPLKSSIGIRRKQSCTPNTWESFEDKLTNNIALYSSSLDELRVFNGATLDFLLIVGHWLLQSCRWSEDKYTRRKRSKARCKIRATVCQLDDVKSRVEVPLFDSQVIIVGNRLHTLIGASGREVSQFNFNCHSD